MLTVEFSIRFQSGRKLSIFFFFWLKLLLWIGISICCILNSTLTYFTILGLFFGYLKGRNAVCPFQSHSMIMYDWSITVTLSSILTKVVFTVYLLFGVSLRISVYELRGKITQKKKKKKS